MKRRKRKLELQSQTVAKLSQDELAQVRGGVDSMLVSGCRDRTQGSVHTGACI